jgi:hypothetical protein
MTPLSGPQGNDGKIPGCRCGAGKRLDRSGQKLLKSTSEHILDWFHIGMRIEQLMQTAGAAELVIENVHVHPDTLLEGARSAKPYERLSLTPTNRRIVEAYGWHAGSSLGEFPHGKHERR